LNSKLNATFWMPSMGTLGGYDTMSLTNKFANHLDFPSNFGANPKTRVLAPGEVNLPFPSNPFGISERNFTDIGKPASWYE
jgi:hypothetical protein